MGMKELLEKLETDSAFAEKFKGCKNLDDVIEMAEKEGYEITEEELEALTDVSVDDLSKAAGGFGLWQVELGGKKLVSQINQMLK